MEFEDRKAIRLRSYQSLATRAVMRLMVAIAANDWRTANTEASYLDAVSGLAAELKAARNKTAVPVI